MSEQPTCGDDAVTQINKLRDAILRSSAETIVALRRTGAAIRELQGSGGEHQPREGHRPGYGGAGLSDPTPTEV